MIKEKPLGRSTENNEHSSRTDGIQRAEKFTARLVCFALVVAFAPFLATFDYSFPGFVLGTPSFNDTFGNTCDSQGVCQMSATQQSPLAIASLFQALGSGLADVAKLGRRAILSIASIVSVAGAILMLALDGNFIAFMAGKCISGFGLGAMLPVGIAFGVECILASKRPVLLSLYGVANAFGTFVGACILVGSARLQPATNNWQWKTLALVQIPGGIALAGLVCCFPESPHWLLIHNSPDKAQNSFSVYFAEDVNSWKILRLMREIQEHLEQEQAMRRSTSWTDIYKDINLRRTVISGFIMTMLALSGVQFILIYGTVFLLQSGISNVFVTNVAISTCTLAGSLMSPASLEFAGCRGSLLWSSAAIALCMITFAAVSIALGAARHVARTTLVVFVCLWAFYFAAGLGSAAWLASSEMHSVRMRMCGQASSMAVYQIWSFAATFWTPYMPRPECGNMGTNVGYF